MRASRGLAWALGALLTASTAQAELPAARDAFARGDYAAAEREALSARGAGRVEGEAIVVQSMLATGRYAEALVRATRLAATPAGRAAGLYWQGESLVRVGRLGEALARWEEAILRGPETPSHWRARAALATWRARQGQRALAREAANPLLDAYNDAVAASEGGRGGARASVLRDPAFLTAVGVAAQALGAPRDANQCFNEALALDAQRAETHVAQAALMLTTEDYGPAGEALAAALRRNPHHAEALVLRAQVRLASNHDLTRARDDLAAALAVNPRLASAVALQAAVALRDDDAAGAARRCDEALALNPQDLDALTTRALLAFHRGDRAAMDAAFEPLRALVPAWSEGYQSLADLADWQHRYAEAAEVLRAALARPPFADDPRAAARMRSLLAFNLLRMGDEAGGLEALRASFAANRYNVRAANLLNFYETTLPAEYVTDTVGPFRIRYHREEAPVLRRFVPALLRQAYDEMVARYGFTPEGPLSIELYASAEHFSVRTAGEPEIGVQGVCFGRVVTALSPRGGPFNWAQILWHELAHVFAIQRSRSRVPRWFTEGLSEWEAFHGHPGWAREDDPALWRALTAGRLPAVADFNHAFTHARSADDTMTAYYAASQLVAFLIERYGFARVAAMLPLFGEGLSTAEAVSRALGVSPAEVDAGFRAAVQARLAPRYARHWDPDLARFTDRAARVAAAEAAPADALRQAEAAAADVVARDLESARTRVARALTLDPAQPLGLYLRARLALLARDARGASADVDVLLAQGRDGPSLRQLERDVALALDDAPRALRALEAARDLDPTQAEVHWALAQAYREARRLDDRLRALEAVVQLEQHHREALGALTAMLAQRGRWDALQALAPRVIELDPANVAVLLRVAHARHVGGDREGAITLYETALDAGASNADAIRQRVTAVRSGGAPGELLRAPRQPQGAHDTGE